MLKTFKGVKTEHRGAYGLNKEDSIDLEGINVFQIYNSKKSKVRTS